ncbi:hypothetical protein KVT40_003339 [Elsinoe batatas]|uniref:Uncharacterized protein n=1 Tax=Elsinoe batatas TaxID=2601811 RepID=A0A8K0PL23_9PEZI|nr:hypothetical protein KVT40_003339 [Elsinoe batatas]
MSARKMLSSGLLALLAIVSSLYLITLLHVSPSRSGLDHVDDPERRFLDIQPGIGFDLTAFYGTVAISYPNGTTHPIHKVEGNEKYRETWKRLSLESSKHIAPPYNNAGEDFNDIPRQQLRRWRKRFGFPASEDVGTIAGMLAALRDEAEQYTGKPVTSAVATIPHLAAVYNEDIIDAFEHISVEMHKQHLLDHLIYETMTAYAGCGYGLCSNFTDIVSCHNESYHSDFDDIMVLLYTRDAFIVSVARMHGGFSLWEPPYRIRQDWTLGSDELLSRTDPDDIDEYWALVRELIFNIYLMQHYDFPSKIILMGESVDSPVFKKNVVEAMEFVADGRAIPPFVDEDPLYVAAKGAAEYAKRAPWTDQWWNIPRTNKTEIDIGDWEGKLVKQDGAR